MFSQGISPKIECCHLEFQKHVSSANQAESLKILKLPTELQRKTEKTKTKMMFLHGFCVFRVSQIKKAKDTS